VWRRRNKRQSAERLSWLSRRPTAAFEKINLAD
jgi:hypothetical protein